QERPLTHRYSLPLHDALPISTSPLSEFKKHDFRTVIGASRSEVEPEKVRRVIACSGKVAYDLIRRRDDKKAWDVAIVRVEQLYPDRKSTRLNSSHVKSSYAVF